MSLNQPTSLKKGMRRALQKPTVKELNVATEIMGVKGDMIVEEAILDIGTEQLIMAPKKNKKTVIFQKEFVERMLGETIASMMNQLNSLFLIFHDKETARQFGTSKEKVDAIKGSYIIFQTELEQVRHCLEPYTKSTMNSRHYASKLICEEGRSRLNNLQDKLMKSKNLNNKVLVKYAEEIVGLMTNFHIVLDDKTKSKARSNVVKEYCG